MQKLDPWCNHCLTRHPKDLMLCRSNLLGQIDKHQKAVAAIHRILVKVLAAQDAERDGKGVGR